MHALRQKNCSQKRNLRVHWVVVKLTTLNLQGFTDWNHRKPEIVDYLKSTQPDIIFFQEVVFLPTISERNQVQLLNDDLQYTYEHSAVTRLQPSPEYEVFREGLAFLSKYPVLKTDTIVLRKAEGDEHNRIVQLMDVQIGHDVVKLANVHFSLTDTVDYATAHLQETLDIIKAQGEPRIIAGDFNLDHLEELSDVWSEDYDASTRVEYISYPSMGKRNDYVLVPKGLHLKHVSTSGNSLSDHRAVTVEIDLVPALVTVRN